MRRLTAAGAVAAAALGSMAPALPRAGAAEVPQSTDGESAANHCVVQAATGRDPRTQTTLGCFDTFAEAQEAATSLGSAQTLDAGAGQAAAMSSSTFPLAWHYEHYNGLGASVVIVGSSCSSTWYPSSWWRTRLSSSVLGSTCSGAKHYALASCAGSNEMANAPWPAANNLVTLNDSVGCVKYQ